MLSPLVWNTVHHMKNSKDFTYLLQSLRAGLEDIMVTFNGTSLLTTLTIKEVLNLLVKHFRGNIMALFGDILKCSYSKLWWQVLQAEKALSFTH